MAPPVSAVQSVAVPLGVYPQQRSVTPRLQGAKAAMVCVQPFACTVQTCRPSVSLPQARLPTGCRRRCSMMMQSLGPLHVGRHAAPDPTVVHTVVRPMRICDGPQHIAVASVQLPKSLIGVAQVIVDPPVHCPLALQVCPDAQLPQLLPQLSTPQTRVPQEHIGLPPVQTPNEHVRPDAHVPQLLPKSSSPH